MSRVIAGFLFIAASGVGTGIFLTYNSSCTASRRYSGPSGLKVAESTDTSQRIQGADPVMTASERDRRPGVAASASEVGALREDVERSRASNRSQAPADAIPNRSDPAARLQYQRQREDHMAEVETRFLAEQTDSRWSSLTSLTVRQAMGTGEQGLGKLQSIDCRSSTCRIELAECEPRKSRQALQKLTVKLASTLPNAEIAYVDKPSGKTMIIYMSKNATGNAHSDR